MLDTICFLANLGDVLSLFMVVVFAFVGVLGLTALSMLRQSDRLDAPIARPPRLYHHR